MRRAGLLAAALAAGCARADLRYAPPRQAFALPSGLAPISSVVFRDASGGLQSAGTGLVLRRPFFDSFRDAMSASLAAMKAPVGGAGGAEVELALTSAEVSRGSGVVADLTATIRYAVRARRGGAPACEREASGWAVLREGVLSSPVAAALESALAKAADNLGPALAASCLNASSAPAAEPAAARAAADADAPPPVGPRDPKLLVLAVGVERYRGGAAPARFAAGDARAFAAYAKAVLGAADDRVALLVDDDATLGALQRHVERWLPGRLGVGDRVVVYFAGRGATDGETGIRYLLPSDGDAGALEQTGFSLRRLYADLGRLPARSFVVLDASFDGAGARSAGAKTAVPVESRPPRKVAVAVAPRGALDDGRGHGLFTRRLLEALRETEDLRVAAAAAASAVEAAR